MVPKLQKIRQGNRSEDRDPEDQRRPPRTTLEQIDEKSQLLSQHLGLDDPPRNTSNKVERPWEVDDSPWFKVVACAIVAGLLMWLFQGIFFDQEQASSSAALGDDDYLKSLKTIEMNHGSEFTGTQFISFNINTFGGKADHGECEGRPVDYNNPEGPTCYIGNDQNITEDVEHRLDILLTVLDKLKNSSSVENLQVDPREDILKVFMVPEFFMRGPGGAYSMSSLMDDGILMDTAHKLHRYISDPAFSEYLFVFGSVTAASRADENNDGPTREWDVSPFNANEVLYYNMAPVFRGGPKGRKHKYIIAKKTISTVDFLDGIPMLPNPKNGDVKIRYDPIPKAFEDLLESQGVKIIRDYTIQVDGIRIGIEVCLDHMLGLLWKSLQENNKEDLVDVLLITSAGMSMEVGPTPIKPGGVAYMTDGVATSSACWRSHKDKTPYDPENVCRLPTPKGIKHFPPIPDQRYSSFFTMSACQEVLDYNDVKGYYSIYQTQGCEMTLSDFGIDIMDELQQHRPALEFYPTVDLPPNREPLLNVGL